MTWLAHLDALRRGFSRQEYLKKREEQKLIELRQELDDEIYLFGVRLSATAYSWQISETGIMEHHRRHMIEDTYISSSWQSASNLLQALILPCSMAATHSDVHL